MVLRFNHLIRSAYSYQIRRLLRKTWQQQTKTFTHHYSVVDLLPSFFLSLENTNCQEATSFNASLDFRTHDRDVVIWLRASAEDIFSVSKIANLCLCSNRNNPGELHSSVETCITRCPHCRSPSWRRLHLGSILKTPSLGKSILNVFSGYCS